MKRIYTLAFASLALLLGSCDNTFVNGFMPDTFACKDFTKHRDETYKDTIGVYNTIDKNYYKNNTEIIDKIRDDLYRKGEDESYKCNGSLMEPSGDASKKLVSQNAPNGMLYAKYFGSLGEKIYQARIGYERELKIQGEKQQKAYDEQEARLVKKHGYEEVYKNNLIYFMHDVTVGNIIASKSGGTLLTSWDDGMYVKRFRVNQVLDDGNSALLMSAGDLPINYLYRWSGADPVIIFRKNKYMEGDFMENGDIRSFHGTSNLVFVGLQSYETVLGSEKQAFVFEFANY